MTTTITGQLEIDHERGVVYFHADEEAIKKWPLTPLRNALIDADWILNRKTPARKALYKQRG